MAAAAAGQRGPARRGPPGVWGPAETAAGPRAARNRGPMAESPARAVAMATLKSLSVAVADAACL